MSKVTFVDRGMQWFLGNHGGNLSQFDPSGQVSPGRNYLPDEIAKMLVKEAGLGKADTVPKRVIVRYLESMGLSSSLAPQVAMVLRDLYGVTPTFDEDVEMTRSEQLIEELDCIVNESYPVPFMIKGPEILTEEESYQAYLVEEYENAIDEEYRGIILALSETSLHDAREIAMFGEWAGPEILDYLCDLMEDGHESLAHEVVEGLVRPNLLGRLSEDAQGLVEVLTPFTKANKLLAKFDKEDARKEKKGLRKDLKRAGKERVAAGPRDPLAYKAAVKKSAEKEGKPLPKRPVGKGFSFGTKTLKTDKPEKSPEPSRLRAAGSKTLELGKRAKSFGNIPGTEPGLKGAAKAAVKAPFKAAGSIAGATIGQFAKSFYKTAKGSYDKQRAIQRGETPAPAQTGTEKKKPGILRRAVGALGRFMSRANPGMAQVAKGSSDSDKGSERRKKEGGSVSGLADDFKRSGNLISEMVDVFDGHVESGVQGGEVRSPRDVIENIDADDVVDRTVLECLSEMSWDDLAQMASIALMPAEESFALLRSLGEGTGAFRDEWRSVEERVELPKGLGRSTFVTLSKISIDEGVVPKVVFWSARALQGACPMVEEYVRESYPELGKTVYGPAGDPKEGPNIAREYMTPYEAGTYAPNAAAKVQDIRYFVDPEERKAQRAERLKDVEGVLSDMEQAAEKAGVPPEGMFLNRWRDMHRERVRYS